MTKKSNDTDPLREQLQPLVDFMLEYDGETLELWMRFFTLGVKPERTEQETEEFEMLFSKIRLADAERSGDPGAKAILLAVEVAGQKALKRAEETGLSGVGVMVATVTAEAKARGDTPSEAREYVLDIFPEHSRSILEAIDEVKRAGLWPWKGVN